MRKNPSFLERLAALEPALVRGFIVTAFGLATAIFGTTIDNETVNNVVTFVLALLGLITALFVRPAVTANAKVLAFVRNPVERPLDVEPGQATVPPAQIDDVVRAATDEAA